MKSWKQISLLSVCVIILLASTPGKPAWQMKADYVEACSCHLFCPCYFNKHAEHPHCEFNMAVKVREGYSGNTNLAGAKYWLTGDLGDEWGTKKKGDWVVVSFDPSTNKEQRDALAPMILKTYGLEWGELKVQEAPIQVDRAGDIVTATLLAALTLAACASPTGSPTPSASASSSAGISPATTRSGTAPGAWGAMTARAEPAARPDPPMPCTRAAISRCQTVAVRSRINNRRGLFARRQVREGGAACEVSRG